MEKRFSFSGGISQAEANLCGFFLRLIPTYLFYLGKVDNPRNSSVMSACFFSGDLTELIFRQPFLEEKETGGFFSLQQVVCYLLFKDSR